ncbi:methionine ABC transporter ATPase [Bacillus manliponensis]|uniref:Methionine ABC transporter ATPase n=1 Tax=Bacillus manliponensis TaxID=574376 RepID=A0A073K6Y2_9BACI|nr:MetQ/NlpA family ABC transporter substrate-binding protein [Bacillus manliponensis]KEK17993.1 methionine ABC transporter ATPase [Bacillus manliponensis]
MKRLFFTLISIVCSMLVITGCTQSASTNKKEIRLGFTPGPYSDQVKKAVKPYLEEKGYKVKIVEFNSPNETTPALLNDDIDGHIHQSTAFMKSYAKENNVKLTGVIQVPSAPQGVYSEKYKSLDDLEDGVEIGVPNDPVNLERALRVLEGVGWLKLKDDVNVLTISEKDVVYKKKNFKLVPLESPQIPRAMKDLDYGVINGNLVIASGHKLTEALELEDTPSQHRIVVVVREENKEKQYVKDLIEAYHSPKFKEMIQTEKEFEGFVLPDYLK